MATAAVGDNCVSPGKRIWLLRPGECQCTFREVDECRIHLESKNGRTWSQPMGDNEESVDAEDDSDIFASVMRWFYHSLM